MVTPTLTKPILVPNSRPQVLPLLRLTLLPLLPQRSNPWMFALPQLVLLDFDPIAGGHDLHTHPSAWRLMSPENLDDLDALDEQVSAPVHYCLPDYFELGNTQSMGDAR